MDNNVVAQWETTKGLLMADYLDTELANQKVSKKVPWRVNTLAGC
jgi:hypothetical protein